MLWQSSVCRTNVVAGPTMEAGSNEAESVVISVKTSINPPEKIHSAIGNVYEFMAVFCMFALWGLLFAVLTD